MIAPLVRYFIPSHLNSGTAEYQGMAFKVSTLLTTGIISFIYIFLALYTEFYVGLYVCLVFVFIHYGLLLSFKKRLTSDNTIAHMFGVMTMSGLSLCSYYTGGHESPILYWFITTLVVGFWFSDLKTRRLWIGIVLLILSFFFLGFAINHPYPVSLNLELFGLFKFLMAAGVFIFLMVVFKTFDVWRFSALKELGELNASKDRMMSIVAHDLKNPLMVMMGHIGLAKAGKPFDQKSLSLFESLNSRMKQIIDNMLIFERLQAGSYKFLFKELDVNYIIEQLIEEFRDQAIQKQITIHFSSKERLVINSDQLAFERILSNILSNALKYTPAQKNIYISLEDKVLSIRDEGIGLTDEVKSSLFQIYSKGGGEVQHSTDTSNGIGLFIVKNLADQLKIGLLAHSDGKDKGTVVTLHFP